MRHVKFIGLVALVLGATMFLSPSTSTPQEPPTEEKPFTTDFRLEECTFRDEGANSFINLMPNFQLVLEGMKDDHVVVLKITVLNETEEVYGVDTRIVEKKVFVDGVLFKVIRVFAAICEETGNIINFGRDVIIYNPDGTISHDGSWRAGENGALPGLIMPGTVLLGARYFKALAPDVDLDKAKIVALGETVETPAGTFSDTVRIIVKSPLMPDMKHELVFAAGIGLIKFDGLLLKSYTIL